MQPLGIGLDWVAKADIDGHGVETPASQLAVDVVTHGSTLADFIEAISSLDCEHEEVAEIGGLRAEEVSSRSLLVVTAAEVDILGRPGTGAEPVVQRQGSLEDPAVACYGDEASQQPVEDDGLPQAHERDAGFLRSVQETPPESGPEASRGRILHAGRAPRAPATRLSTRRPRSLPRSRS